MSENNTSGPLRSAVIFAVVAIIFFGIGYYVHTQSSSISVALGNATNALETVPSGTGPSGQLTIVAAGTLDSLFPAIATQMASIYPSIQVTNATQEYMGSLTAVREITALNRSFDLVATVDPRQIPAYMYPKYANWEICFASDPVVLAYSPSSRFASEINSSNWPSIITQGGVVVGAANANVDPNGYNAEFVLELEGMKLYGNKSAILDHFYVNGPNGTLEPNPAPGGIKISPETQASALLDSGAIDFYFTYKSYAVANHLDYVNLSPWVDLGSFNSTYWDYYKQVSTRIPGPNGSLVNVSGAPVVDCATIPKNSPNVPVAKQFLLTLLSPMGTSLMNAQGFVVISPSYTDNMSALPRSLRPFVTPMPRVLRSTISDN
ncbi:MAG: extracellular solute-binding protein [Candidatus Marsarchaeota archaeon]|nr:extracellular solute-binding protein [Candidatus Marsarchaeota archaeon]